jgi:hypothetical protein
MTFLIERKKSFREQVLYIIMSINFKNNGENTDSQY